MNRHTFVKLSLAEYVVVSLCLALVIAILFPAVHNHIVSKATRLEHQSLYWGMVVVSNIFVYGMLFVAAKESFILMSSSYGGRESTIVAILQGVVINVILFSGALFASLKSHNSSSAIVPRCFCVCVCCFKQCRAKTMRVLVMFSLMVLLYRNIMEAISLFVEPTRVIVITFGLLTLGAHAQRGLR